MASAVGLLGDDLQRFRGVDAIAEFGLIPMDLRGIEATHERQDLVAEDLAGHEHGKAVTNVAETTDSPLSIFSSMSSAGRYSHMVWS